MKPKTFSEGLKILFLFIGLYLENSCLMGGSTFGGIDKIWKGEFTGGDFSRWGAYDQIFDGGGGGVKNMEFPEVSKK